MAKSPDALFDEAVAAHQRGDIATAERICRAILAANGNHVGALYALGGVALGRSDFANAERYFARVVAINPALTDAIFNRGIALAALGQREDAVLAFAAVAALKSGIEAAPALYNQGNMLFDLGRFEEALGCYDDAIAREPNYPVTHNNRGNTLRALHRIDDALAAYARAIALDPSYAEAYNNRGIALQYASRLTEALESYDRAIELRPSLADAFYNRGVVLGDLKRPVDALASLDRAVALQPEYAQAASLAFEMATRICAWGDRARRQDDLTQRTRRGEFVIPRVMLCACDDPAIQAEAARSTATRCPTARMPHPVPRPSPDGRIRIAYLSADFHDHATSRLLIEMIERSDRNRFELSAISFGPDDRSALRRRVEAAFEHFVDAAALSDDAIVSLARRHDIDIAVDLNGYTRGYRVSVLAQRVAPLQVSYLGYAGTMGAGFIDYLIADRTAISVPAEPTFNEAIVYLPDCYQVTDTTRAIPAPAARRGDFGLPEHGFVFCCFNAATKFTPELFAIWLRLLHQIDDSVVWLFAENEAMQVNLRREAAARGIAPERLVFAPLIDPVAHLSRLPLADLFLDTLPYNAHTTASDALWMGLPLLTCAGQSFPARVAASLLKAIGVPELITTSLDDYEQLALVLAREPDRLAAIRAKLVRNRSTHPLFDTSRFCRHIEAAYAEMWERHSRGEKPHSFAVAPID